MSQRLDSHQLVIYYIHQSGRSQLMQYTHSLRLNNLNQNPREGAYKSTLNTTPADRPRLVVRQGFYTNGCSYSGP